MKNGNSLERFITAQETNYQIALSEIKHGKKKSHWMWYIFPQIQGLGFSELSKLYAIKNLDEAAAFLQHPVLGRRLIDICSELLLLKTNNANAIFGRPDDVKLKSSMTLFAAAKNADAVFQLVLDKFFNRTKDQATFRIINGV
jgi:uncharacterized protein (DUF1810 family)